MTAGVNSPVAIVGIGCRFPGGADTPEAFWDLLESGVDPIARMPGDRFALDRFLDPTPGTPGKMVTADGGFLADIDRFDAAFFGLSPREARKIDPQHRLLLEVVWEALEDAGIPPSTLAGKRVAVYAAVWSGEYENVMYRTPEELDFHAITGGGRYAASGRISFAFDFRGAAVTVDTGCSASLVALHLARQAVESGEAEVAIAAAANLVLQPHVNIGYSRSGMLSAGARCRFGDADAAGYVRSDGVGAVVLKPLARARADSDPVRGVLLATAVNADGKGSGQLATPSSEAQAALLETVYAAAGVDPSQVPYVEAHGTGTRAGDPVELSALGQVLGRGRRADQPLMVGSVKSVIGHTEAAAGMAGLIKTLLALEHRRIPANLHLRSPNQAIGWEGLRVQVPAVPRPWPDGAPLVAGISSFGITGTNAHAVVGGAEPEDRAVSRSASGPAVVVLSGRNEAALADAASEMRAWVAERIDGEGPQAAAQPDMLLADLAYTTTGRREQMASRMAIVADSVSDVVTALDDHLAGEASSRVAVGSAPEGATPRVAFVFSGQGSQWLGMGQELMSSAPAFADAIGRCDALLHQIAGWSLRDALAGQVPGALERVDLVQPVLTCVQIALAEQLRAWGVVPQAVVGHSMGEVAAACIAGALSLEDALRVIVTRSRLLAQIAGAGAMALVDLPEEELAQLLGESGGAVSIASVNGPRSTVMSGSPAEVDALLERLDDDGVFCRRVKVDVASHSVQTEPLLAPLRAGLAGIAPLTPAVAFYSTARPESSTDAMLDPGYWVDNLRQPVQLMAAVERMIDDQVDTFIEIAPHPVLLSSLADIAAAGASRTIRTLGGPRREESERYHVLQLLARMHVVGGPVRWEQVLAHGGRVVRLPHYPWQRERHWLDRWEDWSGQGGTTVPVPRPDEADAFTYSVEWEPAVAGSEGVSGVGEWLLIDGGSGLADASADALRAGGSTVRTVPSAAAVAGVLREVSAAGGKVAGIVSFTASPAAVAATDDNESQIAATAGAALATMRALVDSEVNAPTWWVTQGAQTVRGRAGSLESWAQAGVWGLARTLWEEHPELDAHLVDLDPDSSQAVGEILAALSAYRDEPQLAFAAGTALAARLRPAPREVFASAAQWRGDGAYLITGGLGALGLRVAQALVQGGARRLILMGRTPLPPRREWSTLSPGPTAKRVEAVLRLEAQGAAVHLAAVDAGDVQALDAWLQGYRGESWPEIRGVVHCAGVLDNRLLRELPESSLSALMRGKAAAAVNLGRLVPEAERTVYFSSTVPVLPQAGQANYAAANAVLDALAGARTAAGQPTVSLAWGVWKGEGLVADARVGRYVETMEAAGLGSLDPDVAVALFHWTAAAPTAHLILAPIDWAVARARLEGRPGAPFYRDMLGSQVAVVPGEAFRATLGGAAPAAKLGLMVDHLRALVARILDVAPDAVSAGQPLGRQGLDSLMALELRNRLEGELQLRLPASLTWNYPTLERLAAHLIERLEAHGAAAVPAIVEEMVLVERDGHDDRDAQLVAEIVELSDDEILQQLRSEV